MHENPSIWSPSEDFLEGYGIVVSPFRFKVPSHIRFIQAHTGVPWFYAIRFRTDIGLLHEPLSSKTELTLLETRLASKKTKRISMITSAKRGLPGHTWRLRVAEALKAMTDDVDIFGFGHKALEDKAEALDEYTFSVVVENCGSDYYWTEKLADCIIGRACPIYAGARYADNDFDHTIPRIEYGEEPGSAARKILNITENYNMEAHKMEALRRQVLYKHNFMSWIPELLGKHL